MARLAEQSHSRALIGCGGDGLSATVEACATPVKIEGPLRSAHPRFQMPNRDALRTPPVHPRISWDLSLVRDAGDARASRRNDCAVHFSESPAIIVHAQAQILGRFSSKADGWIFVHCNLRRTRDFALLQETVLQLTPASLHRRNLPCKLATYRNSGSSHSSRAHFCFDRRWNGCGAT